MAIKPYLVIEGSDKSIEAFEQKVASALEKGYVLGGELVAHGNSSEIKLYQAMVFDEDSFDDEEDEDEEDEEDEDE